MGVMQALLTSNSARIGGFNITVGDDELSPTNASASITIVSDGTCSFNGNNPPAATNWYTPTVSGIGTLYWVRATVTSGAISSGSSTGTWISCNSSPSWVRNATTISTQTANLTLDFASDSGGTNIVGTASVLLRATKDN